MLKQCCDALEKHQLKIAFIESASSGYLCSQFSIYKNSGADILLGSLVSYDPSIKISILKIEPSLIEQYTAESVEVTDAMAIHGQKLFKTADFIIACTGLLKPGGSASPTKPQGTFYISILQHNTLHRFEYLIDASPVQRLKRLTQSVAEELLHLINTDPSRL